MEGVANTESFKHSDPAWRVPIELPTTFASIDDIRPGDIVYTRRPKGYQRLTALAGDTWRHIGVVTTVGGYPWLLEMAPFGCLGRPLTSVVAMYDTVAFQRLSSCTQQCHITLVNQVAAQLNTPTKFHDRTELATIGLLSWSRLIDEPGPVTRWGRRRAAKKLVERPGFSERAICSTAIAASLAQLCPDHRAHLDVWSPKRNPNRSSASHQLSLPDDIWRALQPKATQRWLKKDDTNAADMIDLTGNEKGDHQMALGI